MNSRLQVLLVDVRTTVWRHVSYVVVITQFRMIRQICHEHCLSAATNEVTSTLSCVRWIGGVQLERCHSTAMHARHGTARHGAPAAPATAAAAAAVERTADPTHTGRHVGRHCRPSKNETAEWPEGLDGWSWFRQKKVSLGWSYTLCYDWIRISSKIDLQLLSYRILRCAEVQRHCTRC